MKRPSAAVAYLALCALFVGCASSGDPVADYYYPGRGGGYIDYQLAKGLFHVAAKGSGGLFISSPDSAREVWGKRATELCGTTEYKELSVREHFINLTSGPSQVLIGMQPHKDGYALCKNAEASEAEALALIQKRR